MNEVQNQGRMLDSTTTEPAFSLVKKGYDPAEVEERLHELSDRVVQSERRAARQEDELREAVDRSELLAQQLDSERDRSASLGKQLSEARQHEEAARLMLHEASKTRDAMLSEAEATLEAARTEAIREATQITEQAMDRASKAIAEANQEGAAILDAGRKELKTLERDAGQRIADLDAQHRELTRRLRVMDSVYTEVRAILRLVAETSMEELLDAQRSIGMLGLSEHEGSTDAPRTGDSALAAAPEKESAPKYTSLSKSTDNRDDVAVPGRSPQTDAVGTVRTERK